MRRLVVSSSIRTITVGPGITPDLLTLKHGDALTARGLSVEDLFILYTAGGDFHPALRICSARVVSNFLKTK
jgi:hypothetical protein